MGALSLKGPRLGVVGGNGWGAGESNEVPEALGRSLQSQRGPWWLHPDFLPRLAHHTRFLGRHGFLFFCQPLRAWGGTAVGPLYVHVTWQQTLTRPCNASV